MNITEVFHAKPYGNFEGEKENLKCWGKLHRHVRDLNSQPKSASIGSWLQGLKPTTTEEDKCKCIIVQVSLLLTPGTDSVTTYIQPSLK